jgi:predicted PurR-regulated permease PerM
MTDAPHEAAAAPFTEQPGGGSVSLTQMRAGLVAAILLLLAGLYTVREFLPALLWAVVFTIGLWPVFNRAARRWPKHRKGLLPALVVLGVLLIFVVPVTLAAVPLAQDAHSLAAWVDHARTAGVPAPPLLDKLPYGARLHATWESNIGQPGQVSELISRTLQGRLIGIGRRFGSEAVHRVVLLGFMLLTLFLLLRQAEEVTAQVRLAARRAFGPAGENVGRQMVLSVHGTVNGLVLVGLAEGAIIGAAYMIVGVPHAALFGLATGLLAIVPFGAAVAIALAGLVLLALNNVVGAIVVVAVGGVVTFVADHFARPVLIGRATRLPFLWVLLGVLGGLRAFGLVGLFLGPAVLAALILLWREWVGSQKGPLNPQLDEV